MAFECTNYSSFIFKIIRKCSSLYRILRVDIHERSRNLSNFFFKNLKGWFIIFDLIKKALWFLKFLKSNWNYMFDIYSNDNQSIIKIKWKLSTVLWSKIEVFLLIFIISKKSDETSLSLGNMIFCLNLNILSVQKIPTRIPLRAKWEQQLI